MATRKRKTDKKEEAKEEKKAKTKQTTITAKGTLSDESPKETKATKKDSGKQLFNKTITEIENIKSIVENETDYVKIISWNVNGLNAFLKKSNFSEYIKKENPDIICLGETKASDGKEPKLKEHLEEWSAEFEEYWNHSAAKKGYSGTLVITKQGFKPTEVTYGIGIEEHDKEGRTITLEYDNYYLVNCYVPNAGSKLVKLDYKMKWDNDFSDYLNKLKEKKHVILCGDLNVAHKEIDIENPTSNKKSAGFSKEEREDFTNFLATGWIDTYREQNPDQKKAYTFWSYKKQAREKDVGWRLDYFVVNKELLPSVHKSFIRKEVLGSDHCPIGLLLSKDITPLPPQHNKEDDN